MLEVKEYVAEFKDGNKKVIKYYPIYELRKAFGEEVKKQGLGHHIDFEIVSTPDMKNFLKGSLITQKSDIQKVDIITILVPIDEVFNSKSPANEFLKLQTRIEKKLYMIYLKVSDPYEAIEEEEVIEEISKQEEVKVPNAKPEIIPTRSKPVFATQQQLKVIEGYLRNQKYSQRLLDFISKYGVKDLSELTYEQAGEVMKFITQMLKEG